MKALIDGDILAYEVGFGSVTGWEGNDPPPFTVAEELLLNKIGNIVALSGATSYQIYLTGKDNFREKIATILPYKGNRQGERPFHYNNLRAYMVGVLDGIIIDGMEADDALAINHTEDTIICSRDKDLRQVEGWLYSWETHNQPSFGPHYITEEEGNRSFFLQCLTGDRIDNIQGLPKYGPVKALKTLGDARTYEEMFEAVREAYRGFYEDCEKADEALLETGRLLWMVRELDDEGQPVMWELEWNLKT